MWPVSLADFVQDVQRAINEGLDDAPHFINIVIGANAFQGALPCAGSSLWRTSMLRSPTAQACAGHCSVRFSIFTLPEDPVASRMCCSIWVPPSVSGLETSANIRARTTTLSLLRGASMLNFSHTIFQKCFASAIKR
ncbi:hypothetical protein OKW38_005384 [Paraburkholderia sp. MM5496-R1]|uniref:hypothetical protein n=1 Tax=Paraburkholderia sp. MM5496-R1 TaxID=2991065 RepID=UPI003D24FB25